MNTNSRWITLGFAFVAGIAATLVVSRLMSPDTSDAVAPAATATEPEVLYWYDPMYPDKRFERPGKSPFMDMDLVPKYVDATTRDTEGTVRIDPRLAQNLGLRTGVAVRGSLDAPVRATVTLAFDEAATSVVQARVGGIVERLIVRTPLATVTRGQALLTLIAPEWTAAQEEYLALRRNAMPALADVRDAARQRLLLLGMTEAQILAVERDGRAQTRITVFAPRAGVVGELTVREGETVMAGTPLMRLNGVDTVWAHAAIAETQIARIREGAAVDLSLTAFPGQTIAGRVAALLPALDPGTRTQTARILLDNPEHRLTAGMIGEARIRVSEAGDAVLVPSEAVIATGTRQVVIVDAGNGVYRAQDVRVGNEAEGRSEILAGVTAGDRVVLSGQFLIDSEANLASTLGRLGDDTEAPSATDVADAPERHPTFGRLLAIDGADWTVDTGPVPSMDMGAMRMTFRAPRSATTVEIGDRFDFSFFRNDDGDFEIDATSIVVRAEPQP